MIRLNVTIPEAKELISKHLLENPQVVVELTQACGVAIQKMICDRVGKDLHHTLATSIHADIAKFLEEAGYRKALKCSRDTYTLPAELSSEIRGHAQSAILEEVDRQVKQGVQEWLRDDIVKTQIILSAAQLLRDTLKKEVKEAVADVLKNIKL